MNQSPFSRALEVATRAHLGQQYNGEPYIEHPKRVAGRLCGETLKTIALLHDVVEDTPVTLRNLQAEFDDMITAAVEAITHRPDEPYFDYIRRCRRNDLARKVKIADLLENISQSRHPLAPANAASLRERYLRALDLLIP